MWFSHLAFWETKNVLRFSRDPGWGILVCMAWNLPQHNHNFLIPAVLLKNRFYWWVKYQKVLKQNYPSMSPTRQNWGTLSLAERIRLPSDKNQETSNVKSKFYWLPDQTNTSLPPIISAHSKQLNAQQQLQEKDAPTPYPGDRRTELL